MSASPEGFHNVSPQGRQARVQKRDKHSFERNRLANRKEGFQRHEPSINPIENAESSLSYMREKDRLHTGK
jgi:hypothetical protein